MQHPVLQVGDQVRFAGGVFRLVALDGLRCRLVEETAGAVQVVLLTHLCADQDFEIVGHDSQGLRGRASAACWGPLDAVDEEVRERALAWQRHVREVETGFPEPGAAGVPRQGYDPAASTLAEREAVKAAELTASGQPVSVATVRRMRARYRTAGVWGLVDGRAKRQRSLFGRADERVVWAIGEAVRAQHGRSAGTLTRLRQRVGWILDDAYGAGTVGVPPATTFNRLVHAVVEGQGPKGLGLSASGRSQDGPEPPFTATVALRPGELVMMDSTALDVLAVLEDGLVGRLELTVALDVATRSITAAVLRPKGTKAVDAAILLAQTLVPEPMRPAWPGVLAMEHSPVDYERLVAVDARIENAAARPVICPSTVVVDQGKVFVSRTFLAAAEHLGISVQPCPPASGHAKGQVERTFASVNTLFCQHVAGYTGSHVGVRGRAVDDDACWTLPQLQEFLDEWVISGWQERRHSELRHPLMPRLTLTPNEMWAALVGMCGHVPVPLSGNDYIELLPARRCRIGAEGIRFDYRTYDSKALNGHRRRSTAPDGKWEVHFNPYEPARCWVRLDEGWAQADWIHRTLVSQPFTDTAWRHIRAVVERRSARAQHEEDLARALDALLRRAAAGTVDPRVRGVAAQARTGAQAAGALRGSAVFSSPAGEETASTTAVGRDQHTPAREGQEWEQDGDVVPAVAPVWGIYDAQEEADKW